MASNLAQCRIRIEPNPQVKEEQITSENELLFTQPDHADSNTSTSENLPLLENTNGSNIDLETRLKWVKEITETFLGPSKAVRSARVRDFDLVLKSDGSIDSLTNNSSNPTEEKAQLRTYPARYRIPKSIVDKIGPVEEQIKRTELFSLGCILYELISGNPLFPKLDDEEIQTHYARGEFPDDVWELSKAVRILACWCPDIAKQLLGARGNGKYLPVRLFLAAHLSFLYVVASYLHLHLNFILR
jgi:serine/threonine protein kinase